MWAQVGNKLGWGLAGLVFVVYVGAIALVEIGGGLAVPTSLTADARGVGPLVLPVGVSEVIAEGAGDGTGVLREIVAEVGRSRELYESFVSSTGVSADVIARLAAIDLVVRQAAYDSGAPWAASPEQVVLYDGVDGRERTGVIALRLAGQATGRVALLRRAQKDPAQARRLWEAELSLGHKLFVARQSYAELSAGLGLMSEAAAGLELLAKDEGDAVRLARLQAFGDGIRELNDRIAPIWAAISTIDPDVMGRHNGDVRVLATRAGERVWRIEATLKLGRMKYDVGTSGTPADQREARKLLRQLMLDPDPAVALAARLGNDLTIEQYRTLR